MTFTLGRFRAEAVGKDNCRVVLDGSGVVVAFCTWLPFDRGRARLLDLMRRLPDVPNPAMDLLIARSLLEFADTGVFRASLACVPRVPDFLAGLYPAERLRRYKNKFAPRWETRWLAIPSRRHSRWP